MSKSSKCVLTRLAEALEELNETLKTSGLVTGGNAVEVEPETPAEEEAVEEEPAEDTEPASDEDSAAEEEPVEEEPVEEEPVEEEVYEEEPVAKAPPAKKSKINPEDLQKLAQKAVKKGHTAEIKVWLSKRKAQSVGTMDPKFYAEALAFLTKLAS